MEELILSGEVCVRAFVCTHVPMSAFTHRRTLAGTQSSVLIDF